MARSKEDNLENYVKVNDRLAEFRTTHPNGLITTFREVDEYGVSFRTVICRTAEEANLFGTTQIAASTGHSYLPGEASGEKMEEYAETVSVGRALANLGLKVENGIASKEEMDQYSRLKGDESDDESEDDDSDEDESEEKEEKPSRRFNSKTKSKEESDDEDEDEDSDDENEEDAEEKEEPKLKSSRKFSGKGSRSSRFGG